MLERACNGDAFGCSVASIQRKLRHGRAGNFQWRACQCFSPQSSSTLGYSSRDFPASLPTAALRDHATFCGVRTRSNLATAGARVRLPLVRQLQGSLNNG